MKAVLVGVQKVNWYMALGALNGYFGIGFICEGPWGMCTIAANVECLT